MNTIDSSKRIQRYRSSEEARHALTSFIYRAHRLHVPRQIDDADMVISDVIDELLDLREVIEKTRTDLLAWADLHNVKAVHEDAIPRFHEIIDKLEEVTKRSAAKAVKEG